MIKRKNLFWIFLLGAFLHCINGWAYSEISKEQLKTQCNVDDETVYTVWYYDDYCYVLVPDFSISQSAFTTSQDSPYYVFKWRKNRWEFVRDDYFYREANLVEGTSNILLVDIFKSHAQKDDGVVALYKLSEGTIVPIAEYNRYSYNDKNLYISDQSFVRDTVFCYPELKNLKCRKKNVSFDLLRTYTLYHKVKSHISWDIPLFLQVSEYAKTDSVHVELTY